MINEIKLKKGELIGKGSFGNVYKCLDESNGRLIVMKEILIEKKDRKEEEIRK
jgi:serine/threonine protein kinase